MLKILKGLVLSIVILFVVAMAGLWILTKTIDDEKIKALISQKISTVTGKRTKIRGAFTWQLFPRPRVKINHIEIGNPGKKEDYSLFINKLAFRLNIMPLFRGHIVFSSIGINQLKMALDTQQPFTHAQPAVNDDASNASQSTSLKPTFAIEQFDLSDSDIVVKQAKQTTSYHHLQLTADNLNLEKKPFSFNLITNLSHKQEGFLLQGKLHYQGTVSALPSLVINQKLLYEGMESKGRLTLDKLRLNQFNIEKIRSNVTFKKGRLNFSDLDMQLYQGRSKGSVLVNLNNQQLSVQQKGQDINSQALFQDALGVMRVEGRLNYQLTLNGPLNNFSIDSAIGKGQLQMKQGQLIGINVPAVIDTIQAQLTSVYTDKKITLQDGLGLTNIDPMVFQQGKTVFKQANIRFSFDHGMLRAEDLLLLTDTLEIKGHATIALADGAISGRIDVRVRDSQNSKLNEIQQKLGGQFPIRITGSLQKPILLPDTSLIVPVIRNFLLKDSIKKHLLNF